MADEVLLRVPLNLNDTRLSGGPARRAVEDSTMEVEEDSVSMHGDSDLAGIVKELNATCYEFQREQTRRMICRVRIQTANATTTQLAESLCRLLLES